MRSVNHREPVWTREVVLLEVGRFLVRPFVVTLATALLAACTPLGGSLAPTQLPTAAPAAVVAAAVPQQISPSAFADCPVTKPVTDERPKNPNTASFSSAWFVSPDRLLWASAGDRFWADGNKVLWERPTSADLSISTSNSPRSPGRAQV